MASPTVRRLSAAALLALVTGTVGCTSAKPSDNTKAPASTSMTSPAAPGGTSGQAEALQQQFVEVVAKVRPQVVQISTGRGLGSGVVYDQGGNIVTNAHVASGATSLTVQLVSGQQLPAQLVGIYAPDDLAVVRVRGAARLSPATFANSDALQIGDIVFAVGNPLGLSSSVTEGIVSYNGRSVNEGNGVVLPSTVQTSAPINPGNSGGALVDLAGDVVGIPTLAAADQQDGGAAAGIGFAIPANVVKLIAPQLIATGRVTRSNRAALEVSAADAVNQQGAPVGAIVTQVTPGSSAAQAGITPGQLITAIEGKPVTSLADLQSIVAQFPPGATVTVDLVNQSGVRRSIRVLLGQLQS